MQSVFMDGGVCRAGIRMNHSIENNVFTLNYRMLAQMSVL